MNKIKLILRSTVANLYFYPSLMLGFAIAISVGIFSRKKMISLWDNHLHPIIFKPMLKLCGIEIEVRGKEYIKPGFIFASKHESAFETYAYTGIIKNSVFVLKKELTYIPLFGWGQALYGMIPIDRGAGAKAMKGMLKEAKDRVKKGRNIIIFPEGTRCKHLQVKGYKSGIVFLAEGLDMPIVPVALNSDLCWSKASFIRRPGKVIFEFLPPMRVSDYKNKKEFMEALQDKIETTCQKIA
ncbi:MAG: 1-acyl-sn-glycerol-3-phosphate acyltransferase [Alphaproteobacteria bacterium]|nr:1-acyl-sn-glycerol-3-phosphate acyltransferase [Alphaproteobacteria bacterium]